MDKNWYFASLNKSYQNEAVVKHQTAKQMEEGQKKQQEKKKNGGHKKDKHLSNGLVFGNM